jgi:hypothetical protein
MRSRPAESARGPMEKMPHRGRVTVWPSPSVPCGLGFLVSNFRVWPRQRHEEVQLSSAHWWRPTDWGQDPQPPTMLPAHGRAELDLEMYTEPLLTAKAEFKLSKAYRKPSGLHCVRYGSQTCQSGFGLWTEGGGRPWRSVQTQESPSYGLTSPSLTPAEAL